jgi:Tol biopolymer transport system component
MRARWLARWTLAALVVASACLAAVPAAEASFPGRNGLIAFVRGGGHGGWTIRVVDPRSGRTRQLTHVSRRCSRPGTWVDYAPSFSASGRLLVYVHADSCDPRTPNGIFLMRPDGGKRRLLTPILTEPEDGKSWPVISPSGELLAYDLVVGYPRVAPLRRPRRWRPLFNDENNVFRYTDVLQPAWSSTGKLALVLGSDYATSGVGHIGIAIGPRQDVQVVTRSRRDAMPDWSPSGDRIAFFREKARLISRIDEPSYWVIRGDVFTTPARSEPDPEPRRLTETRDAFTPVWSPDGRYIAYVRSKDLSSFFEFGEGEGSLWIMRANGGGQRLIARDVTADRISWQPRPRR